MTHHDVTDRLGRIDPVDTDRLLASWDSSDASRALRDEIAMVEPVTDHGRDPGVPEPRANRLRRRWPVPVVVAAATVGVVAAAGAAGLLPGSDPALTTTCRFEPGTSSVINAITGDPVADCVSEWANQSDEPAPALKAYRTQVGEVVVVPAVAVPDASWTRVTGDIQDAVVLELGTALADAADGLPSRCHSSEAATALVRSELDRLELGSWTVTTEQGTADGDDTCVVAWLDGNTKEVVVVPMGPEVVIASDKPIGRFARAVAAELGNRCLGLADAEAAILDAGREAGMVELGLTITSIEDPAADCTRVDVTVGGRIDAIARGPARP